MSRHSFPLRRFRKTPLALLLLAFAFPAEALDLFFVTNTNDSGVGSLRQALLEANQSNDGDENRILFAIADVGPHTIRPLSELPFLTGSQIIIDGLTQTDSDCSSWPPTLQIELNGSLLPPGLRDGIELGGNDNVVRGLVINGFSGAGILSANTNGGGVPGGGHRIECNRIGTNVSGTAAVPNRWGIFINLANNLAIGDGSQAMGNLISGNLEDGIYLDGDETDIRGNLIGTNANGTLPLPNGNGIRIVGGTDNTAGGLSFFEGNTVAGNDQSGIEITGADAFANFVFGNFVGTNNAGAVSIPNGVGISISNGATDNVIGANLAGAANLIFENIGAGVRVAGENTVRNSIVGNRMSLNGGRGIQLGNGIGGPLANDLSDADEGPNRQQNHPTLYDAILNPFTDELIVWYRVESDAAFADYNLLVDFYAADPDGQEGIEPIGRDIYTGGVESATITLSIPVQILKELGNRVVATATDASGNTSEFSTTVIVPEPSTNLMFLTGAGLLAGLWRRRKGLAAAT